MTQAFAGIVTAFYFDGLPNPTTATDDPKVELIILIANKLLVKESDSVENLAAPTSEVNRIDRTGIMRIMSTRATASKRGLESSCDGFAHPFPTLGNPRATDVVGSCFLEDFYALTNVVRSISRVSVHPDDDRPTRFPYRSIETGREHGTTLVDHPNPRIAACHLPNCLPCTVVGHPIRHDHFKISTW